MTGTVQVGRVAIRHEGKMVNAYYADAQTMEGAVLMASITARAASLPGVQAKFIELATQIVSSVSTEVGLAEPAWGSPERAPEHERAGNA